jgi:quinolinate synthase
MGRREEWDTDRVILMPDEYLAKNVAAQTGIKIIAWHGRCEVHERFTAEDIAEAARRASGRRGAGAPGMPAGRVGGGGLRRLDGCAANYVVDKQPRKVVLLTECSMSDNVAAECADVDFIRPCNLCPHMKRITLEAIYDCAGRDEAASK